MLGKKVAHMSRQELGDFVRQNPEFLLYPVLADYYSHTMAASRDSSDDVYLDRTMWMLKATMGCVFNTLAAGRELQCRSHHSIFVLLPVSVFSSVGAALVAESYKTHALVHTLPQERAAGLCTYVSEAVGEKLHKLRSAPS